jgi:hypothetical protein
MTAKTHRYSSKAAVKAAGKTTALAASLIIGLLVQALHPLLLKASEVSHCKPLVIRTFTYPLGTALVQIT